MKKSFTLIEVLISITILGILFNFLFSITSDIKKQNQHLISKSTNIFNQKTIFKTLVSDFSQSIDSPSVIYGKNYDIVRFSSKNSYYGIIEPVITYYVSKKEHSLIRTESLNKYDLYKKEDIYENQILADILCDKVSSFKVYYKDNFYNILLRTETLEPIVLKLPLVR